MKISLKFFKTCFFSSENIYIEIKHLKLVRMLNILMWDDIYEIFILVHLNIFGCNVRTFILS